MKRLRRNRQSLSIRNLIQETHLQKTQLVQPCFIQQGTGIKKPLEGIEENFLFSLDELLKEIEQLFFLGINAILLFPCISPSQKDSTGSFARDRKNFFYSAIKQIKKQFPELCVFCDLALDPYTTHGHDGLVGENGTILNDETVAVLAEVSVYLAEAGADYVAPSDMMDGRVKAIRNKLDAASFYNVGIMSYAAKYASSFYGPYRQALKSSSKNFDKSTYQLGPENIREAILECLLDEEEGADIIMVKPAAFYLDVLHLLRQKTNLPISAYHVSGEYACLVAAAEKGFLDFDRALYEVSISIKRAGADFIFTYGAKRLARLLDGKRL